MGKEKFIPLLAIIILLIGSSSALYVYASQQSLERAYLTAITINDKQYEFDYLFGNVEQRTLEELNFSGAALDGLIERTDVGCPSCHSYNIIGDDGYQKTVSWKNMQSGLLTQDKMVVFPDLPRAFRVKNVVEIEVI